MHSFSRARSGSVVRQGFAAGIAAYSLSPLASPRFHSVLAADTCAAPLAIVAVLSCPGGGDGGKPGACRWKRPAPASRGVPCDRADLDAHAVTGWLAYPCFAARRLNFSALLPLSHPRSTAFGCKSQGTAEVCHGEAIAALALCRRL